MRFTPCPIYPGRTAVLIHSSSMLARLVRRLPMWVPVYMVGARRRIGDSQFVHIGFTRRGL
jgi:hypothetical protein